MRQRLAREPFVYADATRRCVMPALEKVFVLLRARAERDEERAGLKDARGRLLNQVVTFLRHEPRDDRDDGAL